MTTDPAVAAAIEGFTPRLVSAAAACFAKEVTAASAPATAARAKAFLFAASRLGAFGEARGLKLVPEVLLQSSVIERFCAPGVLQMSSATRRTVRTNLRALNQRVLAAAFALPPCHEKGPRPPTAKPRSPPTWAWPTPSRRWRAGFASRRSSAWEQGPGSSAAT